MDVEAGDAAMKVFRPATISMAKTFRKDKDTSVEPGRCGPLDHRGQSVAGHVGDRSKDGGDQRQAGGRGFHKYVNPDRSSFWRQLSKYRA